MVGQTGELTGSFAAFSALASLRHTPRGFDFIYNRGQFSNFVPYNDSKFSGVCGIEQVTVNVLDEPWNWDRFVKQRGSLKMI